MSVLDTYKHIFMLQFKIPNYKHQNILNRM